MWASSSGPGTRLSTGMTWESRDMPGVNLFAAPACVGAGILAHSRVASWTPPSSRPIGLGLRLQDRVPGLILVPLLDTMKVSDGPADVTRPDQQKPHHLTRADNTLILAIVDILMDPSWQVGG